MRGFIPDTQTGHSRVYGGAVHGATPIYGSGGFSSYHNDALRTQM